MYLPPLDHALFPTWKIYPNKAYLWKPKSVLELRVVKGSCPGVFLCTLKVCTFGFASKSQGIWPFGTQSLGLQIKEGYKLKVSVIGFEPKEWYTILDLILFFCGVPCEFVRN